MEAPELDDLIGALSDGRAQPPRRLFPSWTSAPGIANTVADPVDLVGRNFAKGQPLLAFSASVGGWRAAGAAHQFRPAWIERIVPARVIVSMPVSKWSNRTPSTNPWSRRTLTAAPARA